MLTLTQIAQQYPESLRPFKRALLREYLQYKILEIVAQSDHAPKLSFIGGTALRIVYGNTRFSEDLDFDNFALAEGEFTALAEEVRVGLDAQGLKTEIAIVGKDAYRCNVRFPDILYDNDLSPHEDEKVLLQIDTLAHGIRYAPDAKIINKFDVFTAVPTTPPAILLSQKLYAAINRRRAKGRDFFDIVFLLSFTTPNYPYLREKIGVSASDDLRTKFLESIADLDFTALGRDVQPFLFNSADVTRVERFREFFTQTRLG